MADRTEISDYHWESTNSGYWLAKSSSRWVILTALSTGTALKDGSRTSLLSSSWKIYLKSCWSSRRHFGITRPSVSTSRCFRLLDWLLRWLNFPLTWVLRLQPRKSTCSSTISSPRLWPTALTMAGFKDLRAWLLTAAFCLRNGSTWEEWTPPLISTKSASTCHLH